MHACPPGDQRRPVERFELIEVGTVDYPSDHLPRIEGETQIGRDDSEQFFGVGQWVDGGMWPRSLFDPIQPGDDASAERDGISFVSGEVVGQSRCAGMHLGPAERLIIGLLAGGHLHQWRSGQEHLRALLDHHHVIGHTGYVRPASGGVAEHQGDGRYAGGRQPGQVAEHLAARNEDLLLGGKIGAAGLYQRDHRKSVLPRDLVGAQHFFQCPRIRGSTFDGRVVCHQHALGALDDADACHHARACGEVCSEGGQCAQFQERGVLVNE